MVFRPLSGPSSARLGHGQNLAGRLAVKRATITDVAAAAGVSIKTVSRVLNGEPNVKPDTEARIRSAMAALNYTPSVSARSLAGARSYLIGLLFDNPSPAYVGDLQMGALRRCRQAGYHLIIESLDSTAPDVAATVAELVSTLRVDGLILTPPVCDHPQILAELDRAGTPYVRIAPDLEPGRTAFVHMDDRAAAYEMTALLLAQGHRDIAFIKGHPEHGASHLRFEGYAAAVAEAGVALREDRTAQGYFSFRSGVEAAELLLAGEDRPTAVFASNDDMALGVMSVASRLGLAVPQDLSIAGFDDTPTARVVWPQMTTVRQPIAEMSAAAADLLISGAAGQAVSRLLPFEVIARESTGPARR